MIATQNVLVALTAGRILIGADVRPESLVGRTVEMPTLQGNEVAEYRIESVSTNRETGDVSAYLTRQGVAGGRHARLVTRR